MPKERERKRERKAVIMSYSVSIPIAIKGERKGRKKKWWEKTKNVVAYTHNILYVLFILPPLLLLPFHPLLPLLLQLLLSFERRQASQSKPKRRIFYKQYRQQWQRKKKKLPVLTDTCPMSQDVVWYMLKNEAITHQTPSPQRFNNAFVSLAHSQQRLHTKARKKNAVTGHAALSSWPIDRF